MKVDHIAIWVTSLAQMQEFYIGYFGATSNKLYFNQEKNYYSYFLSFDDGAQIKLMYLPSTKPRNQNYREQCKGLAHLTFKIGSREKVDFLIAKLEKDGYSVIARPCLTGEGYYEGTILDPEENIVAVVA